MTMTFEIIKFKPMTKSTLRGFFTVKLPSGMVIHDCTIHEKGKGRWVSLPSRKYTKHDGTESWAPVVEFCSREAADKFRDLCVDALDRAGYGRQPQEQESRPREDFVHP